MIEADLQKYPMDAYLHSVAGLPLYRLDTLERALYHWRAANDIEPSKYLEAMIAKIAREKGADKAILVAQLEKKRATVEVERGNFFNEVYKVK